LLGVAAWLHHDGDLGRGTTRIRTVSLGLGDSSSATSAFIAVRSCRKLAQQSALPVVRMRSASAAFSTMIDPSCGQMLTVTQLLHGTRPST
jgi:hypothetical protein